MSIRVGKISSRYLAVGAKNKNLAGRSGIGVLVVEFSRIEALKKCPLVCDRKSTLSVEKFSDLQCFYLHYVFTNSQDKAH